ncbi:MAG: class A beta-lactamase-related serine hydrolase [Candidatus Aminicenantes bacterium]|nr:class A beta-lactamase-related serine hydrolase [Candidatus Aminicenantes bacterium]
MAKRVLSLLSVLIFLTVLSLAPSAAVQSAKMPPTSLDRLRASIERITTSVNATWGIYVKSLDTGEEIAIDADRQMDTMSVIKIPLMAEVFTQIKAGKFALTDRYTLTKEDILPGTGVLRVLDPGDTFTVKDLLTLMNIVSDNSATDILYRMVGGPEVVNKRMEEMGLKQTVAPANARAWFDALSAEKDRAKFHREAKHPFGLSTPREIGQLLEAMERGTLVDKPSSDLMLRMMRGQIYRTRIPRFLSGFGVPHKTGDFLPFIANDVGVLESRGATIVVSIFTANHFGNGWALEEAIGHVAVEVAAYFGYRR